MCSILKCVDFINRQYNFVKIVTLHQYNSKNYKVNSLSWACVLSHFVSPFELFINFFVQIKNHFSFSYKLRD